MVTFVKDPSPQTSNVDGSTVGTDVSNEIMDRLGLARPTAARAIVTDGSGFFVVSATTSTEVGYLSGVTSAIQTQLNAKQATLSDAANIVYTDATATMTAAHTYTTGLLKVADLVDANGKVSLAIAATASAVDGLTITNAATANPAYVGLSATGTDSNVGIKLVPKGTGKIRITDGTDTTKILALDLSGATAAKTMTFAISHTNDHTITFPDSTATLATTAQLTDGSTITSLVNAQIASGAAIELSKLATVTASKALVSDSGGLITSSSVTSTELGYVSGVTSAIQTQIDSKQATLSDAAHIVYTDATATMTAAKTYTTGLLKVADLVDANGNVSLAIAATASAVDGLTITNAATANPAYVGLSATGTDTNVGITISPKGTGKIRVTDGTDTTKILAWNLSGATTAKTMTFAISHTNDRTITFPDGTVTLATTAQLTDGSTITGLVNAQVASGAAIALSKLATVTASKALVSDSGGLITASSVTSTELGYVSGVTSAIQTQIDGKITTTLSSAKINVGNGSNVATAVTLSGDITNDNAGVVTIANSAVTAAKASTGTGSTNLCIGNDSRLSDARTPTSHNVLDSTKHGDVLTGSITRGDVIIGNSTPKIARLAVGAAGQVLQVNSGGTDPAWANYLSNFQWLSSFSPVQPPNTGSTTAANGRIYFVPIYVPTNLTISRFDFLLNTLGGAGTHLRLGLYADNGRTPVGGALLWDSGDLVADATAQKDIALTAGTPSATINLTQGFVWACVETNDTTAKITTVGSVGGYTDQGSEVLSGCHVNQTYGALPATCPATSGVSLFDKPLVFLRVSAVN